MLLTRERFVGSILRPDRSILSLAFLAVLSLVPLAALWILGGGDSPARAPTGEWMHEGWRPWQLLGRTVLLGGSAGMVGTVLGWAAGQAIAFQPWPRQKPWLALMIVPLLIPPFVHALAWIALANRLGISIHGFAATVVVLGFSYWPIAGFISWAAANRIHGDLVEAAMLQASQPQALWRLRWGLLKAPLITSVLFITLFAISDYGVPSLLRVMTYPVLVFAEFAAHHDVRSGVLIAGPYLVLPVLALILWRHFVAARLFGTIGSRLRPGSEQQKRGAWLFCMGAVGGILILTALAPIAGLALMTGGVEAMIKAWTAASTQVWVSLALGGIAATVMVLTGLLPAWSLAKDRGWPRMAQEYLLFLPVILPGTLLGMGLLLLFNRPFWRFLDEFPVVVVLLCVARFLPFAVWAEVIGIRTVAPSLVESARLRSGLFGTAGVKILLPLLAPYLVVGWALGFVFTIHELTGTLLVIPPGFETISIRTYSLYHYGASELVAGLALLLVGIGIAITGLLIAVFRCLRAP